MSVRYAQGGGLTAGEREFREEIRMVAAERFAAGATSEEIAAELRVSLRSVERWRSAWRRGGQQALVSKGPASHSKLSPVQFARLETALSEGPVVHGWDDQRWTLARITRLIGRMFHVSYTPRGTWGLLRRNGWSWQAPARRAVERDEEAIEVWKKEVWPTVERRPRPPGPGWCSRTSPDAS